ncbi:MAG TPA: urea ABC transporter permease subunit UrtB, partial [Stellaceae bacterium]|nr:urea ABC transporter permease subunit UrtB [Stellaceae bacterium]
MRGRGRGRGRRLLPAGLVLAALLLPLLLAAAPASAGADPFAQIAAGNFDVEAQGVRALAVSGNPRAPAVIAALRAGLLFAWKWPRPDAPLYIRTDKGFLDARTGAAVTAPAPVNLRRVIVNDSVRAAIEGAAGALDLTSPDAGLRLKAAEALFQSADPGALPLIEHALATEKSAAVARVLREARAAALLKSGAGPIAARLAAVRELSVRSDLATKSLFSSLHGQPPQVAAAIRAAIADIDRQLQLWGLVENVYYGLSLGAVLLLAAS